MTGNLRADIEALCAESEAKERALAGIWHSPTGIYPHRLRAILAAHPAEESAVQYGRRDRRTGIAYPLRGDPLPGYFAEAQTDFVHIQRQVTPWVEVSS